MGLVLDGQQTINGQMGRLDVRDDDQLKWIFIKEVVTLNPNVSVDTTSFKSCANNTDQTKLGSVKYSGSITLYTGSPYFKNIVNIYARTNKYPVIKFKVTLFKSTDPTDISEITVYNDVQILSVDLGKIDVDSTVLKDEVTFSCNSIEMLQSFPQTDGEYDWS